MRKKGVFRYKPGSVPLSTSAKVLLLDKKVDAVSTFSSNGSVGNSVQIPVISYSKQGLITAVSTTAPAITINGTSRSSWTIKVGTNVDIATNTTSGIITVNAVLPVIKVDSTGKILDQNSTSIVANYVDLSSQATVVSNASTLPNTAGMYLVYKDGYIPKVAIVKYSSDEGKYSFV